MSVTALREHETPSEAAMRVAATVMRKISMRPAEVGEMHTIATPETTVDFDDLRPGDLIRVAGGWQAIEVVRSDRMLKLRDEQGISWYPADLGERFVRYEDGF